MFNLELDGSSIFEAVTTAEVKAHARIYTSADDAYIDDLCISAREQVEKDLEIAVVQQKYKLHLEHWLDFRYYDRLYHYGMTPFFPQPYFFTALWPRLLIPIEPVQSVESITYTDGNGSPQTLDPSLYLLKTFKDPPHILYLDVASLPAIQLYTDIVVSFTAGYTTGTLPKLIKHAVMFLAANWYENRESSTALNLKDVPQAYERIINRLRVKRFW